MLALTPLDSRWKPHFSFSDVHVALVEDASNGSGHRRPPEELFVSEGNENETTLLENDTASIDELVATSSELNGVAQVVESLVERTDFSLPETDGELVVPAVTVPKLYASIEYGKEPFGESYALHEGSFSSYASFGYHSGFVSSSPAAVFYSPFAPVRYRLWRPDLKIGKRASYGSQKQTYRAEPARPQYHSSASVEYRADNSQLVLESIGYGIEQQREINVPELASYPPMETRQYVSPTVTTLVLDGISSYVQSSEVPLPITQTSDTHYLHGQHSGVSEMPVSVSLHDDGGIYRNIGEHEEVVDARAPVIGESHEFGFGLERIIVPTVHLVEHVDSQGDGWHSFIFDGELQLEDIAGADASDYLSVVVQVLNDAGYDVEIQNVDYMVEGKQQQGHILVDKDRPDEVFYHIFIDGKALAYEEGKDNPYKLMEAVSGKRVSVVAHGRDFQGLPEQMFEHIDDKCGVDSFRYELDGRDPIQNVGAIAYQTLIAKGYSVSEIAKIEQQGQLRISGQLQKGELGGEALSLSDVVDHQRYRSLEIAVLR